MCPFTEMALHQQALANIVLNDPNVDTFVSAVGPGGPTATSNAGRLFMCLKPTTERKLAMDGVMQEMTAKMEKLPRHSLLPAKPGVSAHGRTEHKRHLSADSSKHRLW